MPARRASVSRTARASVRLVPSGEASGQVAAVDPPDQIPELPEQPVQLRQELLWVFRRGLAFLHQRARPQALAQLHDALLGIGTQGQCLAELHEHHLLAVTRWAGSWGSKTRTYKVPAWLRVSPWIGSRDSNPGLLIQSQPSYR